MGGIVFINYRRRDAEHVAGRLFDRLEQDFSEDQLFFDVDDIPPGEDFVDYLHAQVAACDVLLALVGPNWHSALDAHDYGDGEQTKDFVRIEIEAALQKDKKVIPVLVSGAEMPREEDLPKSLRAFSRRNAVRLTHERFKADAAGIASALKAALADAEEARNAAERQRAEEEREAKAARDAKAQTEKDTARREAIAGLSPEHVAKAEELANWDFIKDRDEPQELRDHLARFPDGVSARMATERLETLLWRDLGEDEVALKAFLEEFPDGPHAGEAAARIETLEKARKEERVKNEREAKERAAWSAVKDTADPDTLAAFLADHPDGAHAGEARRLKRALQGGLFTRRNMLAGAAGIAIVAALVTAVTMIGFRDVPVYGPVRTFDADDVFATAVVFSPDGRTALSAEDASGSRLWDVTTGETLESFGHELVKDVAFSPDGHTAFSAGFAGFKLWDLATGEELPPFKGKESFAYAIVVAPDGRTVLTSNYVETRGEKDIHKLLLWDVESGDQLRTFERPDGENPGHLIAFSPDGSTIMSAGTDKIEQWDVATGALIRTIEPPVEVKSIAWAPDGRSVLSAGYDGLLTLWDIETREILWTLEGHEGKTDAVAISPDGSLGLSGARDGTIKLWDLATGDEIGIFKGHPFDVLSVAFSPDGRNALSSSLDGTMKLWDVTR